MKIKKTAILMALFACLIGVSESQATTYFTIPTATINIDGNFNDWGAVPIAIQDLHNDIYGDVPYIDIDKVYIAQDQDYIYFRIDTMGDLETSQFPCSNWMNVSVNFNSQSNNLGINMNIDPFGQGTGQVNIWDHDLQTQLMSYPSSAGFGALSGNKVEFKVPKSHMNIGQDLQQISSYSYEDCAGASDNTSSIYVQDFSVGGTTYPVWYQDSDNDGYGNPQSTTMAPAQPSGYVSDNTDCNDSNPYVYPGAPEIVGDGIDQDCNGSDLSPSTTQIWYYDSDGDGFGDANNTSNAATKPAGYVSDNTDCNDSNPYVYPGAPEIVGDGIDQDCNGSDLTSSAQVEQISLLSPTNNEAIGFGTAGGKVTFSFSKIIDAAKYMLYLDLSDILNSTSFVVPVELIPPGGSTGGDIWTGISLSTPGFSETFIGMVYDLSLDAAAWDVLALYDIKWGVEAYDTNGTLIGSTLEGSTSVKYVRNLKFIASNSISMTSPSLGEELSQTGSAPTFKWGAYQNVTTYTLILAHAGSLGFDSVLTKDNLTLTLFPMDNAAWQSMPTGKWYWTILGYNAMGSPTPSGFTIFDFEVQ